MRSKERWERFFRGEPIDRAPIWLLYPYHPVSYYTDVYGNPSYREILAKVEKHDIDILDRRDFETGFCFNVSEDIGYKEDHREGPEDSLIINKTVEHGDIRLTSSYIRRDNSSMRTKSFVSSIDDLLSILELPYTPPRPPLEPFFQEREELEGKGLMMADAGDAIEALYHLCDPADLSMWSVLEKDKLVFFLDQIHLRVMDFYRYLLDSGVGPIFFAVGAEFMGPPMIAPGDFWQLAGKYLQEMVSLVHSYGHYFILHYHGNIKRVLPDIARINPDAVHTIEAPPVGDCTIREAREILGERIAIVGNIQYDDLQRLDEEEIKDLVRETMNEDRSGRFILSPTAGPYEDDISDKMIRNYIALIEEGVRK